MKQNIKIAKELVKLAKELTSGQFDDKIQIKGGQFDDKIQIKGGQFDDKISITAGYFDEITINEFVTNSIDSIIKEFNQTKNIEKNNTSSNDNYKFSLVLPYKKYDAFISGKEIQLKFYLGTQNDGKNPIILLYTDCIYNKKEILHDSSKLMVQYTRGYKGGFDETWNISSDMLTEEELTYKIHANVENWLKNISGKLSSILEKQLFK